MPWSKNQGEMAHFGPSVPFTFGTPYVNGNGDPAALTKHIVLCVHIVLWFSGAFMTKRVKEITTIQVTPETRDRIYRLKFRSTYEEFLNELCDLYESANRSVQK